MKLVRRAVGAGRRREPDAGHAAGRCQCAGRPRHGRLSIRPPPSRWPTLQGNAHHLRAARAGARPDRSPERVRSPASRRRCPCCARPPRAARPGWMSGCPDGRTRTPAGSGPSKTQLKELTWHIYVTVGPDTSSFSNQRRIWIYHHGKLVKDWLVVPGAPRPGHPHRPVLRRGERQGGLQVPRRPVRTGHERPLKHLHSRSTAVQARSRSTGWPTAFRPSRARPCPTAACACSTATSSGWPTGSTRAPRSRILR